MRPPSETGLKPNEPFIAVEIPTHETLVFENIIFTTVPISGRIRAAPYPDCRVGRTRIHFTFSLLVQQRFKSSYVSGLSTFTAG